MSADPDPASSAKAKRPRGTLTVLCQPQCDSILDNGKWIGNGSVFNRSVAAGHHSLVLTANGVRKTVVADVQPDTTRELRVVMEDGVKAPPPESGL
jgi:serine/threonine-protein kinase